MLIFLCFSLGVLVGIAIVARRGLEEILAFVVAPVILVIVIKLTSTSLDQASGSPTFIDAGKTLGAGLVTGVILAGLPALTLLGSHLTQLNIGGPSSWRAGLQWPEWLRRLNLTTANRTTTTVIYYETAVKLGALIAMADSISDRRELATLRSVFNINASTCPNAAKIYQRQAASPQTLKQIVRPFIRTFGFQSSNAETLIYGMAKIALADGQADSIEVKHIWKTATLLGIPVEDVSRIITTAGIGSQNSRTRSDFKWRADTQYHAHERPLTERERHLRTLGLRDGANTQEIRAAWRHLAAKYHPDKLTSRHIPPDELKKAEELMKEINAAYDWLKE